MDLHELAKQAREKCSACKHEIPIKKMGGKLMHLDLFSTYEHGASYLCLAEELVAQAVKGCDEKDNPIYEDGWEEIMEELWEKDPDIPDDPDDEEEDASIGNFT